MGTGALVRRYWRRAPQLTVTQANQRPCGKADSDLTWSQLRRRRRPHHSLKPLVRPRFTVGSAAPELKALAGRCPAALTGPEGQGQGIIHVSSHVQLQH